MNTASVSFSEWTTPCILSGNESLIPVKFSPTLVSGLIQVKWQKEVFVQSSFSYPVVVDFLSKLEICILFTNRRVLEMYYSISSPLQSEWIFPVNFSSKFLFYLQIGESLRCIIASSLLNHQKHQKILSLNLKD